MSAKTISKNELAVLVCRYFLDLIDTRKCTEYPAFGDEYENVSLAIEHISKMPDVINKEDVEGLGHPYLDCIAEDWEFCMDAI